MMRVLSLDPGITTGVAVYNDQARLKFSMAVPAEEILKNGFLNKLVSLSQPEVVLIEDIPTRAPHPDQAALHQELCRWFRVAGFQVENIQPSQWKGLVKRVEIPGEHARDAATMAKWWIEKTT